MTALKNHWITWLSIIAAGFMLVTGTAMTVTGGEFNETEVRVVGIFGVLGGLLALAGLVSLRSRLTNPTLAYGMIVLAMSILAIGYWWFVFVPPLVAVVVVWAGVIREGLSRELHAG